MERNMEILLNNLLYLEIKSSSILVLWKSTTIIFSSWFNYNK